MRKWEGNKIMGKSAKELKKDILSKVVDCDNCSKLKSAREELCNNCEAKMTRKEYNDKLNKALKSAREETAREIFGFIENHRSINKDKLENGYHFGLILIRKKYYWKIRKRFIKSKQGEVKK